MNDTSTPIQIESVSHCLMLRLWDEYCEAIAQLNKAQNEKNLKAAEEKHALWAQMFLLQSRPVTSWEMH